MQNTTYTMQSINKFSNDESSIAMYMLELQEIETKDRCYQNNTLSQTILHGQSYNVLISQDILHNDPSDSEIGSIDVFKMTRKFNGNLYFNNACSYGHIATMELVKKIFKLHNSCKRNYR